MSSAPLERAFTSLAIHSKLIAADSGAALTCAKTSFFGCAWAKAGGRPAARMPAMPAEAVSSVRRGSLGRVMGVLPIAEVIVFAGLGARFSWATGYRMPQAAPVPWRASGEQGTKRQRVRGREGVRGVVEDAPALGASGVPQRVGILRDALGPV